MSMYDYTRGAMDAEFIGHMTGGGNLATLKQMREQMDKLSENALAWKKHAEKLGEQLKETQRALAEESIEKRSAIARSNAILQEAELCREYPNIKPVFSALGEENRKERDRLQEAYATEIREAGRLRKPEMDKEDFLQYHMKRSQGIDKPEFDR